MMGKNNMMNEEPENEVPFGSLEEEVADDIPVMLSEGEYVIPADVVRYWGLKHLEEMRMMAKCGLMSMQQDGRLHMVDEEGKPVETEAQTKPQIEVVEIDIQAMQDDMSKDEEDDDEEEDDMDKQMEMFDDVDFDGKDEEDILMLNGGGDVSGDNGTADGQGDEVDDEDEDVGTGRAGTGGINDPTGGVGTGQDLGVDPFGGVTGIGPQGVSTPTEVAEATIAAVEKPTEYSALYDKATKDMSRAELAQARTYGLLNNERSLQELAATPDKVGFVDAVANARHAQDPTSAQLDLNALTEKGFQTENPGVVGVTNALAATLSSINPAFASVLAAGNVINAATGRETLAGFGVPSMISEVFGLGQTSIAQAIGDQLSGLAQDVVDFSETVPGNIEETIDSGVEAGKDVGSSDEDQLKRQTKLPDMRELLSLTAQIEGIDKKIPIRNSLVSQAINNSKATQPATT
jgi:hypothetical protein